jgi:hypothetical protein
MLNSDPDQTLILHNNCKIVRSLIRYLIFRLSGYSIALHAGTITHDNKQMREVLASPVFVAVYRQALESCRSEEIGEVKEVT